MRKLMMLAGAALAVATLAIPSSATAWTHCGTPQAESDCPPITTCLNGVETQVPDNGTYQPGECPKPPECQAPQVLNPDTGQCETPPPVCAPGQNLVNGECVTPPPVQPPVTPPVTPPEQPGPPVQPPLVDKPVHVDTPNVVVGKEEQGKPVRPEKQPVVEAKTTAGTLPFTGGFPILALALLGGGLAVGGARLRSRLS